MDEYVPASRPAITLGKGTILSVGIRDVKREMKTALRIAAVDCVDAFWGPLIALELFMSKRRIPELKAAIGPDRATLVISDQQPF